MTKRLSLSDMIINLITREFDTIKPDLIEVGTINWKSILINNSPHIPILIEIKIDRIHIDKDNKVYYIGK